jgi:hypothetical protein
MSKDAVDDVRPWLVDGVAEIGCLLTPDSGAKWASLRGRI